MNSKNNKGFTLIEVIISLALMGIVAAMIYSLFDFNLKSYAIGNRQSHLQSEVRLSAGNLTKIVRNADKMQLIDTPATFDVSKRYIFTRNNEIVFYNKGNEIILSSANHSRFTVSFTKSSTANRSLAFTIRGTDGNETFYLDSEVLIQNLGTDVLEQSGNAIMFSSADALSGQEAVIADANQISLAYLGDIEASEIYLPTTGINSSTITWFSLSSSIVITTVSGSIIGTVSRPTNADKEVQLTATITNGEFSETRYFTVTILKIDTLVLLGETLPSGIEGDEYGYDIEPTGGDGNYSFSSLDKPSWMNIDASTGRLSGKPLNKDVTAPNSIQFVVHVVDGLSNSVDALFTIVIMSKH